MLPTVLPAGEPRHGTARSTCPQPSSPAPRHLVHPWDGHHVRATGKIRSPGPSPSVLSLGCPIPIPWLVRSRPKRGAGVSSWLCERAAGVAVPGCFWGMHHGGKRWQRWLERQSTAEPGVAVKPGSEGWRPRSPANALTTAFKGQRAQAAGMRAQRLPRCRWWTSRWERRMSPSCQGPRRSLIMRAARAAMGAASGGGVWRSSWCAGEFKIKEKVVLFQKAIYSAAIMPRYLCW